MVVVVLEGANCIGKTTISNMFKDYKFQHIHFPSSKNDLRDRNIGRIIGNHKLYDSSWGDMFRSESIDSLYRHSYAKLDILTNLDAIIDVSKSRNIIIDRLSLSNSIYSGGDKMLFSDMINNLFNNEMKMIVLYTNNPQLLKDRLLNREKVCEYTKKNIEYIDKSNTYMNTMYKNVEKRDYIIKICVDGKDPKELFGEILSRLRFP